MSFLKGNKNKRKRILSIVGLVFLIIAVFAGIVLVQQNQDIREDAAGGCKFITDAKDCRGACGAPKSSGQQFECRWDARDNKCEETSKGCGGGGGGNTSPTTCTAMGGVCSDISIVRLMDCNTVVSTSDCSRSNNKACCVSATTAATTIPSGPPPTTHSSTCRSGDVVTQVCGVGWVSGQILVPCVKKQTKVCVYGNWEVRERCGEKQPACL